MCRCLFYHMGWWGSQVVKVFACYTTDLGLISHMGQMCESIYYAPPDPFLCHDIDAVVLKMAWNHTRSLIVHWQCETHHIVSASIGMIHFSVVTLIVFWEHHIFKSNTHIHVQSLQILMLFVISICKAVKHCGQFTHFQINAPNFFNRPKQAKPLFTQYILMETCLKRTHSVGCRAFVAADLIWVTLGSVHGWMHEVSALMIIICPVN